jgi:hypothetical protein
MISKEPSRSSSIIIRSGKVVNSRWTRSRLLLCGNTNNSSKLIRVPIPIPIRTRMPISGFHTNPNRKSRLLPILGIRVRTRHIRTSMVILRPKDKVIHTKVKLKLKVSDNKANPNRLQLQLPALPLGYRFPTPFSALELAVATTLAMTMPTVVTVKVPTPSSIACTDTLSPDINTPTQAVHLEKPRLHSMVGTGQCSEHTPFRHHRLWRIHRYSHTHRDETKTRPLKSVHPARELRHLACPWT